MLAGRPHEAAGNGSPRWMAAGPRSRGCTEPGLQAGSPLTPPWPERGVEYAGFPTEEFAEARSLSAVGGPAKFLGVTEARPRALEDRDAYGGAVWTAGSAVVINALTCVLYRAQDDPWEFFCSCSR